MCSGVRANSPLGSFVNCGPTNSPGFVHRTTRCPMSRLQIMGAPHVRVSRYRFVGFSSASPASAFSRTRARSRSAAAGSRAGDPEDLIGLFLLDGADGGGGLGVVDIQDRDVPVLVLAGMDAAAAEDEAGVVEPREGHGEAGTVLVTVVQADEGIVGVSADDAFGGVGDHIARREAGVAALHSLGDVVADSRYAEWKTYEPGALAALLDLPREFIGMHIAEITFQQGNSDADLRLVKVLIAHTESVEEGGYSPLPAAGQVPAVPVQVFHAGAPSARLTAGSIVNLEAADQSHLLWRFKREDRGDRVRLQAPVSYTHLTLPTNREV